MSTTFAVDRVIDGDTVDANIDLGFDITIHKRIRLAGIDTPESRTRDLEEKKFGLAAKDYLKHWIEEQEYVINMTKRMVKEYKKEISQL